MGIFLIGYTIIVLAVAFVALVLLTGNGVIFRNNVMMRNIFGRPLTYYSVRRIISAIISILLAVTVTYLLIRLQDPLQLCKTAIQNYSKLTPEVQELRCFELQDRLGINGNVIQRLFQYYYKILPFPKTVCQIDFVEVGGVYYNEVRNCRNFIIDLDRVYFIPAYRGEYVLDVIFKQKMSHSFRIGIIASVLQLGLGYPAGILMAKYKDGIFDKIGKGYIISISAIPGVAYYYIWMSILVFALGLPVRYSADNFLSWLPAILTMAFTGMAGIALWVRRYMLEEFSADYVKFARSKGLSENKIMYTHILRNAIVPLVRSIPAAILGSLLGTFYIERIYGIPGLGGFLIDANTVSDFFALQGIVVISAIISVVSYVLGDIATAMVDPRISFSKE